MKPSIKPENTKQIARQRIDALFHEAQQVNQANPNLAKEYVQLARKIAMASRIRLSTEHRRQFCKNCNTLLIYGSNCRVRLQQKREPHIVATCLNCGNMTRIPIKSKSLVQSEQ
jgi:ribonuclease P protein subunit RPR2